MTLDEAIAVLESQWCAPDVECRFCDAERLVIAEVRRMREELARVDAVQFAWAQQENLMSFVTICAERIAAARRGES